MTNSNQVTMDYVNLIEPSCLVQSFIDCPPHGFQVAFSSDAIITFTTDFDLLTTVEPEQRKSIQGYPLFKWWQKLLRLRTCFVGTTVTEYGVFPKRLSVEKLHRDIEQHCTRHQALTIIKDLPKVSPLLSASENEYAQTLTEYCKAKGYIEVEGQALAYVPIDFKDINEYMSRLSSSRRKDIRRKLKAKEQLTVTIVHTGDSQFTDEIWLQQLYDLYLAVYQQSEIHFDLLSAGFFKRILQDNESEGCVFLYWQGEQLIGYNLCYVRHGYLIDKYIGLRYPEAKQYNLYFVSWMQNLQYALDNQLNYYVAGWTDPKVKASLGAKFTFTRHLVWVKNPLLRALIRRFRHLFESDSQLLEDKTS